LFKESYSLPQSIYDKSKEFHDDLINAWGLSRMIFHLEQSLRERLDAAPPEQELDKQQRDAINKNSESQKSAADNLKQLLGKANHLKSEIFDASKKYGKWYILED
jgi:hypothetical protein